MTKWGSPSERQTAIRMRLAAAAYAYEIDNDPIISDEDFDAGCRLVDLRISTTRPDLDDFFDRHFSPDTGMWIHRHPELHKVKAYLERLRDPQAHWEKVQARIDQLLKDPEPCPSRPSSLPTASIPRARG